MTSNSCTNLVALFGLTTKLSTMAAADQESNFFSSFASDILESVEKAANVIDEGLAFIASGMDDSKSSNSNKNPPSQSSPPAMPPASEFRDFGISEEDIEEGEEFHSPLEGIAEGVLKDAMKKNKGPETVMQHFHAFRSAITWSEPFILGLIGFQVLMFLGSLWVSRKDRGLTPRLIVMVTVGGTVRLAERMNRWGGQNWRSFATQNYFDERGIFTAIMVCGPLLLDCLIMLFCFWREASTLLVQVKSRQIRDQRKKRKEGESSTRLKKDQ